MIRILLAFPIILLLVVFALSNPQPVQLRMWPTDYALEVPLSIAVLVGMGAAFVIGAFLLWFTAVAAKARARRAEREARRLREEVASLQKRLDVPMRVHGTVPQRSASPALPGAPRMALLTDR